MNYKFMLVTIFVNNCKCLYKKEKAGVTDLSHI